MLRGKFVIQASDYRDHRSLALAKTNLWENNGWMVWDRIDGEDILLWVSPYRLIGHGPNSVYALSDVALSQTLLIRGRYDGASRSQMHDNAFLCVGYDLGDHLDGDELRISLGDDAATWRVGSRTFTSAPPEWTIRGDHAGLNVDLRISAMGPPFWFTNPADETEISQERWFLACARVQGQLTHLGDTLSINGYGSHERHIHCGPRYDPVKTLSARGITWHSGSANDLQIIMLSRPSRGIAWCRIVTERELVDFSAPAHSCEIIETDFWIDPQSRMQIPCAWRSTFIGPSGTLELHARAFARAYYLWPHFKHGCTILYWWMADASIEWKRANGERLCVHGLQYVVHDNRLLYRQHVND